ncbi:MAG TPA: type 1 glutamine amidotransferase [Ornithinimicrobium sp.]|uniref:type 1 glutamine amidotransferase n=1 Tax=Ornithinimicrobium sp. TaxID=1977084 RepID=UPI002B47B280|nr:type 1 glutamine amidotransferase [Ornithinimicrobium sp.]HKJ12693.1 type 1 glutamine amidotransferase [Ornithinimicrobium sp.]
MVLPVLVVQHADTCPPALLGESLAEGGLQLDIRCGHRGDTIPATASEHSALVILGGAMGAHDEQKYDWLAPTKDLIHDALSRTTPMLGVCLGHQLIGAAMGGSSVPNPAGKARGLTRFHPNAAGMQDPLLSSAEPGSLGLQWNGDILSPMPEGGTVLATAPDSSVQAARFGPRAWGVQFHPEVTPEIFRGWAIHRSTGADSARVLEALHDAATEFDHRQDEVFAAWRPLGLRFAEIVHAYAAGDATAGLEIGLR